MTYTVTHPYSFDRDRFDEIYAKLTNVPGVLSDHQQLPWGFNVGRFEKVMPEGKNDWHMNFDQWEAMCSDSQRMMPRVLPLFTGSHNRFAVWRLKAWAKLNPGNITAKLEYRVIDCIFAVTCEVAEMSVELAELLTRLESAEYKLEQAAFGDELSQAAVQPLLAPLRLTGEAMRSQVRSLVDAGVATEVTSDTQLYPILEGLVADAEAYVRGHRKARAALVDSRLTEHRDAFLAEAKELRQLLRLDNSADRAAAMGIIES